MLYKVVLTFKCVDEILPWFQLSQFKCLQFIYLFILQYLQEFAKCVSTLDPLLFSNDTGFNGAKLVVSFEWKHNVFAEYAGLCTDIPDHHMKQYALGSGIVLNSFVVKVDAC